MKKTRSLKGTPIWMVDEITQQLKNRKQKLAKVTAARYQGKWGVYTGGKAIIEACCTPKNPNFATP
eukprot:c33902_g1_i1 orf=174-371(-)